MDHYLTRDTVNMVHYSGRPLAKPLPAVEPFTLRFLFLDDNQNYRPTDYQFARGTWTQRSDTIWDWTYQDPTWTIWQNNGTSTSNSIFSISSTSSTSRLTGIKFKIIDSNTTDVTNMRRLFFGLSIKSINHIDTSNVTDTTEMFRNSTIETVNGILNLSSLKHYNGTTAHGTASYMFNCSNTTNKLLAIPNIIWPNDRTVDLYYMFANQRYVTTGLSGSYPSDYSTWQGSTSRMCMNCGDIGNPTAYANIPSALK